MDSEQLKEIYNTYFYYFIIGGIVFGLLMGTVPLILSISRKRLNLGVIGLVISGICGAFSPLLSIIAAAIFIILVIRKSTVERSANSEISVEADLPK